MSFQSNLLRELKRRYRTELIPLYGDKEALALLNGLISHFFGLSATDQVLHSDFRLSESEMLKIHFAVKELKEEKPIQYITGEREFAGLKLKVAPGVLIPRPETEELTEKIIAANQKKQSPEILDIGTGSGCIALALKKGLPHSRVTAVDVSSEAVTVAKENSRITSLDINVLPFDILDNKQWDRFGLFDIIVSNPPYVTQSDKKLMKKNVLHYEPETALFVPDGNPLLFYSAIAGFAKAHLKPNGQLWFEINENFGDEVVELLQKNGFNHVRLLRDIFGKNRFVTAHL